MSSRTFAPAPSTRDVPSPCVDVCRMNEATGYCEGCWRTIDEIAGWPVMTPEEKRKVVNGLDNRRLARE